MKTYVKKPVKIQAFEFDGTVQSLIDNLPFVDMHKFWNTIYNSGNGPDDKVRVNELASGESEIVSFKIPDMEYFNRFSGESIYIDTLEGPLKASKGDYIIQGIKGEYYSCKPDVFKATYDEVIKDEN